MMQMRKAKVLFVTGVVLVGLVFGAVPAFAGASSSGGPWSWSRGGVVAKFSGSHSAADNRAYGQTNDYNGVCGDLKVRLKYNPGSVDSGWFTSVGAPSIYTIFAGTGTTAVSSEHQAQHNFDLSWSSGIQRPHSW
jgi:hypothetical protein